MLKHSLTLLSIPFLNASKGLIRVQILAYVIYLAYFYDVGRKKIKASYYDRNSNHRFHIVHINASFETAQKLKLRAYCYMILGNIPMYIIGLVHYENYIKKFPKMSDAYNSIKRLKKYKPPNTQTILNRSKPHYIYSLSDPNTKEVKYIGCSINPKHRFYQHISHGYISHNDAKDEWTDSLVKIGQRPILNIMGKFPNKYDALEMESFLIHEFTKKHFPLVNKNKAI